ncbi:MAG: anti-sigma F factor [Christensenellales bacterium]|jgi:stage II sporulation protein AB (anti-sigma F factor)
MQDKGNYMELSFPSYSENESFARVVAASFAAQLNPTIEELEDVKTAVSEAVTNAVIHGYEQEIGVVRMRLWIEADVLFIQVEDTGKGIEDIERAMEPMYTSKPEMERSGLGFTVMESFTDGLEVKTHVGRGTTVTMHKRLGVQPDGAEN